MEKYTSDYWNEFYSSGNIMSYLFYKLEQKEPDEKSNMASNKR